MLSANTHALENIRKALGIDLLQVDGSGHTLNERLKNDIFECPTSRSTDPTYSGKVVCPGYTWIDPSSNSKKYWLDGIKLTGKGVIISTAEDSYHTVWGLQEVGANGNFYYRNTANKDITQNDPDHILSSLSELGSGHSAGTWSCALGNGWGWDYKGKNLVELDNLKQQYTGPSKCFGREQSHFQAYDFINKRRFDEGGVDYDGPHYDIRGNLNYRGIAPGATMSKDNGPTNISSPSPEWDVRFSATGKGKVTGNMTLLGYPTGVTKTDGSYFNYYNSFAQEDDIFTSRHNTNHRILVNSAGNQGDYSQIHAFNYAHGFFSLYYSGKNAIVAGLNNVENLLTKNQLSSLGPTRDGRIGITIMAPGNHFIGPGELNYKYVNGQISKSEFGCNEMDITPPAIRGSFGWSPSGGTSESAPVVAGVVAMMLENYQEKVLSGASLKSRNKFWNSTVRGILIHTATDMSMESPRAAEFYAQYKAGGADVDLGITKPMPAIGPDWATGYGAMNPAEAIRYAGTPNLIQETAIQNGSTHEYKFAGNVGDNLRLTLAWDDPEFPTFDVNDQFTKHLINDLDMVLISPSNQKYYPWQLDGNCLYEKGLPRVIYPNGKEPLQESWIQECQGKKGPDHINNNEVIDLVLPEAGEWKVAINGTYIPLSQSLIEPVLAQDYSLISTVPLSNPTITTASQTTVTTTTTQKILNFDEPNAFYSVDSDPAQWVFVADNQGGTKFHMTPYAGKNYLELNMKAEMHEPLISAAQMADLNIHFSLKDPTLNEIPTYMGNIQVFFNSPEHGLYRQYLGQTELWCGGTLKCDGGLIANLQLPDFDTDRSLWEALASNDAKKLDFIFSISPNLGAGASLDLEKLEFNLVNEPNLPVVDCSNLPFASEVPPNYEPFQMKSEMKFKFRGQMTRFECLDSPVLGRKLDWCNDKEIFCPACLDYQYNKYTQKWVPKYPITTTYWPSAWKKTGVCQ